MWPSRRRKRDIVTCIACGTELDRDDAREYDKHGDRWNRDGKEFEHLCKPCFRDLSNVSRTGLEDLLTDLGAGTVSTEEFLARYADESGPPAEGESTGRYD